MNYRFEVTPDNEEEKLMCWNLVQLEIFSRRPGWFQTVYQIEMSVIGFGRMLNHQVLKISIQ
jgi:hypothetical protein